MAGQRDLGERRLVRTGPWEQLDLVVANPPVVISPDNVLLYRDSAIGGEALSRQMVRGSARHLADGGFATVFCNSARAEGSWEDPPQEWVADLGCDSLILKFGSHTALVYAMNNVNDRPGLDPGFVSETVERWGRPLPSHGGGGDCHGRDRAAGSERPNWTRSFHTDRLPAGAGSDQLERMFAGGDFLASHSGVDQLRELMSSSWHLVEGHELKQALVYENGAYSGEALLGQGRMNLYARVDPRVVTVVAGCDGRRPLAEVLAETPIPEGLDQAEFQQLCLSTVRDLIARGFLVKDGSKPS